MWLLRWRMLILLQDMTFQNTAAWLEKAQITWRVHVHWDVEQVILLCMQLNSWKKGRHNWTQNKDRFILVPYGWVSIFKVNLIWKMLPIPIHWRPGARGQNHLSDSGKSVLIILHWMCLLRMGLFSHFDLWCRLSHTAFERCSTNSTSCPRV
jgi:hypothetical protein